MQGGQTGPRSFGQVMDAAFGIYTRQFVPLAKIAALILLPIALIIFVVDLWAFSPIRIQDADFNDLIRLDGEIIEQSRVNVDIAITLILNLLGYLVVVAASVRGASQAYLGNQVEAGPSLRFAGGRFGHVFWLGLILTLLIGIGWIALILPGIYLTIVWILAMPALMVEDKRGFKALGRSNFLVKDSWWRTFGIVLVVGIFTAIVSGLLPDLLSGAIESVGEDNFTLWLVLQNMINALAVIVSAPLWAAVVTVVYYDMRVRKEAFDIEMMAGMLDEPGGMAPGAAGGSQPPPGAPLPAQGSPALQSPPASPPASPPRSEPPPA